MSPYSQALSKRDSARRRPRGKGGAPSKYDETIARRINAQVANGRALAHICRQNGMPSITTVFRWIASHEEFRESYARARDASADLYAERIIDIADRTLAGELDPQAARVAIDALKWTASKLKPKVYGDNRQIDVNATVEDRRVVDAPSWVKEQITSDGTKPLRPLVVDAATGEVVTDED